MENQSNIIFQIEVPEQLKSTLSKRGFDNLRIDISDVAACLSMVASKPKLIKEAAESILINEDDEDGDEIVPELIKEAAESILSAAASIRQSTLQAKLDLPVVIIIDISWIDEAMDQNIRKDFTRWATDQDWHRGDFAMYICPPIPLDRIEESSSDEKSEWTKPRSREDLVQHLLGRGADDWGLPPVERPTLETIIQEIVKYIDETPEAQSGVCGDFLTTIRNALLEIRKSKPEISQGHTPFKGIIDRALAGWEKNNLTSPGQDGGFLEVNHE